MNSLLSLSDGSNIDSLSHKASAALAKYVPEQVDRTKSDKSLTIHLVTRFFALTSYQDHWVHPPTKMYVLASPHSSSIFVFKDVAIAHPLLCGYGGAAAQTIRTAVDGDLGKNFTLVEEDEKGHRQVEYLKVCTKSPSTAVRMVWAAAPP